MSDARSEGRLTAMRQTAKRAFTLIDAMIVIAASALSLVMIRDYLNDERVLRILSAPDVWSISQIWIRGCVYVGVLAPLAVSLSLALFILRLRRPRPEMRRLLRQPGMVASTATVIAGCLFVLKFLLSYYLGAPNRPIWTQPLYQLWMTRLPWSGEVAAAAWILLWLSGNWHSEASWIDRAGRALGVYWIVTGIFFNFILRYY
jgi:hypothetical protein